MTAMLQAMKLKSYKNILNLVFMQVFACRIVKDVNSVKFMTANYLNVVVVMTDFLIALIVLKINACSALMGSISTMYMIVLNKHLGTHVFIILALKDSVKQLIRNVKIRNFKIVYYANKIKILNYKFVIYVSQVFMLTLLAYAYVHKII